ncbi:MAG: putative dehydrogenase [Planctomycetota bacterium]|jgi:predicted dehydrogenase
MNEQESRRSVLKKLCLSIGVISLDSTSVVQACDGQEFLEPQLEAGTFKKPITAITLGAGSRGNVYGNYAVRYPDRLDIVGAAEPIEIRRQRYAKKHKIAKENLVTTWEHIFKRPKFADAIIITTPDDLHYGPCMAALEMGYDILLEKPISPSEQECKNIHAMVEKTGRIVAVCHVLRYAPYFQKLKEIVSSGVLGKVVSMQHFEPIEHLHMSHSYVRGNWHNSKKTTPILLAKSCHDLDLIRWIMDQECTHIQAFGGLDWFTKANAPKGATARCTDGCAVEDTCVYSALKLYHRRRGYTHVFDLPDDRKKHGDAILNYLKTTNYGRCVYDMENDQPDHYTVNMQFKDGATTAFSMEAFTSYHGRRTRVMGSMGDIVGDMTQFTYTDFATGKKTEWKGVSDGHGGGDWRLVTDWLKAIQARDSSLLVSTIDESIESHVMGYRAEISRLKGTVEKVSL